MAAIKSRFFVKNPDLSIMIFTEYSSKTLAAAISEMDEDDLLQKILVPVDFSECSNSAIRHAVAVAIRTGATIILVNTVNLPMVAPEAGVISMGDLENEAAAKLSKMAAEITHWLDRERLRVVEIKFQVRSGFVSDEILNLAEKDDADLIVMGTRGAGNVVGTLLGSNASTVMQKAHCPVLIVPEDAEFAGYGEIVFATDMMEIDVETITRLVDFATHFSANLQIVHVLHKQDYLSPEQASAFKERFAEVANYDKLGFHIVSADGRTVVEAIEDYVEENSIDVLAIQNQERGFLDKIFKPSVSKKLAVHAKIPLIAFH